MSKQRRFFNPFSFIYQHSGILAPMREYLEDAEDVGDYILAAIYLVVVLWCLYVAALIIPPYQINIALVVAAVFAAVSVTWAHLRRK